MLNFKKATLEDKQLIDELLYKNESPSLEYNFTTIFLWQDLFNTEFAVSDGVLFIRYGDEEKFYLFPCGSGDVEAAADMLVNIGVEFYSLSEKHKLYLENRFPGHFTFEEKRDDGDYVYTTESLMKLAGKKLSSKRNHINRFVSENPDWIYEKITSKNMAEVVEMHRIWCEKADLEDNDGLRDETFAVKKALEYFEPLKLSGGLIRAGGRVVAFSVGDRLSKDTFLVHIEKAFGEITGAYQIINREFVRNNCEEYEFVNREEDTGDEGLRKAKLSYKPCKIIKKFTARKV